MLTELGPRRPRPREVIEADVLACQPVAGDHVGDRSLDVGNRVRAGEGKHRDLQEQRHQTA